MREIALLLGSIAILIGVMLLFAPRILVRVGEETNAIYNIDGIVYRNRYLFGVLLILASFFMTYTAR